MCSNAKVVARRRSGTNNSVGAPQFQMDLMIVGDLKMEKFSSRFVLAEDDVAQAAIGSQNSTGPCVDFSFEEARLDLLGLGRHWSLKFVEHVRRILLLLLGFVVGSMLIWAVQTLRSLQGFGNWLHDIILCRDSFERSCPISLPSYWQGKYTVYTLQLVEIHFETRSTCWLFTLPTPRL